MEELMKWVIISTYRRYDSIATVYFLPFSHGELLQLVERELEAWAERAR